MNRILKSLASSQAIKYNASCTAFHTNSQLCSFVDTPQNKPYVPVADFFAGKTILVTGGTGFLGKILLEKLLYSCKDLKKIYVLIRENERANLEQRHKELLANPIFGRVRSTKPQMLSKIVPIRGDITVPELGIRPQDEETILNEVSVVFNTAANVRFIEPLQSTIETNLLGTTRIVTLTQKIKNLQAFVHVSSVYAHCDRGIVEELFYPQPKTLDEIKWFLKYHGNDEQETMKFLEGRPNPYTLAKALAENYVLENHKHVPTVLVRPSIISPSAHEPLVGWLDNWYGATRILYDVAIGANRPILGKPTNVMDVIPVDYVSNLCIVAATTCKRSEEIPVYHSCSSNCNPISWEQGFEVFTNEYAKKHKVGPFPPKVIFTSSPYVKRLLTYVLQTTPALLSDIWLHIKREKGRNLQTSEKVAFVRDFLEYFTARTWTMKDVEARKLWQTLSLEDRKEFNCNPSNIRWAEYMPQFYKGVEKYLVSK